MATKVKQVQPSELAPADLEWLRSLESRLWRETAPDRFQRRYSWPTEVTLTPEEIDRFKKLIIQHALPCTLGEGQHGDIGIHIWRHPSVPGLKPEIIVSIWENHIPGLKEDRSRGIGNTSRKVWKFFHDQIAGTERNLELLTLYGLPKPKPIEDYDY